MKIPLPAIALLALLSTAASAADDWSGAPQVGIGKAERARLEEFARPPAPAAAEAAKAGPPAGYRLVWSDEFDGRTLDPAKWATRLPGKRLDGITDPDCAALDGAGHLELTTKKVGAEYHAAMIGTQGKFEAQYGYFEARVRMQTQPGHAAAFWIQSPRIDDVSAPPAEAGAEIDVFEYFPRFGDSLQHTLHWGGYGSSHAMVKSMASAPGLSAGWHTVAVLWTAAEYVFYVDGRETWRTSQAVSHRPEYLILSVEVRPWAGDIKMARLPDALAVDYVRVYQPVQ